MFAQGLHPTWGGRWGRVSHRGAPLTESGHRSGPPPPPARPHGPPSPATVLTSLHDSGLIAGTHGQHLEHTAGGPEQLLVTVVAHDVHESLGSSVGQDDELWREGGNECETDGTMTGNREGRGGDRAVITVLHLKPEELL